MTFCQSRNSPAQCAFMCVYVCVCALTSSCLTIAWSTIGRCSHMSNKGWTMYPWCSTCLWISRTWSLLLVSELPLSGSQVRTLLCLHIGNKLNKSLAINVELNYAEKYFFTSTSVPKWSSYASLLLCSKLVLLLMIRFNQIWLNIYFIYIFILSIICNNMSLTHTFSIWRVITYIEKNHYLLSVTF